MILKLPEVGDVWQSINGRLWLVEKIEKEIISWSNETKQNPSEKFYSWISNGFHYKGKLK